VKIQKKFPPSSLNRQDNRVARPGTQMSGRITA